MGIAFRMTYVKVLRIQTADKLLCEEECVNRKIKKNINTLILIIGYRNNIMILFVYETSNISLIIYGSNIALKPSPNHLDTDILTIGDLHFLHKNSQGKTNTRALTFYCVDCIIIGEVYPPEEQFQTLNCHLQSSFYVSVVSSSSPFHTVYFFMENCRSEQS